MPAPKPPTMPADTLTKLKIVLHAGCGGPDPERIGRCFPATDWREIRLDIDPQTRPDLLGSIVDMRALVQDASVDAVFASHLVEHLDDGEVAHALTEFHRVLRPDGFALLRCPDLEAAAEAVLAQGPDAVIYTSRAGPITALDMLFGHRASIAAGREPMRHRTAFTADRLGAVLVGAGFAEVRCRRTNRYEIVALAFREEADIAAEIPRLAATGMDLAA